KKKQTNSDYKFWNRVEFQLRHKVANEFCNPSFRLNTKTGEIKSFDGTFEDRSFPKTAYYYLKFLAPSYKMINDKKEETLYLVEKHKRHWDHCEWWTDFLRTGEGQNIGLPKNETGLEDLKDWQLNQCSGADYLLMKTYGQKYSHEKLLEGKKKFENNKRYQILFKEYQSKSNTVKEEDFS
ncbi:MAG: replication initiation factor, partial [Leptospira sp.]|nr:replication initiation factor [Leptospira sp.]